MIQIGSVWIASCFDPRPNFHFPVSDPFIRAFTGAARPFAMIYETELEESASESPARPGVANPLPPETVLLERATAALRKHLRELGLEGYFIFHAYDFDLDDLDRLLPGLEEHASWQPVPLLSGAEQPQLLETGGASHLQPAGIIHLPKHCFVLARWHRINLFYDTRETLLLAAAPSHETYKQLHQAVIELRRKGDKPTWQIFRTASRQETKRRKPLEWSELLLSEAVLGRIRAELINFFTDPVAELYRTLQVPYRRGVLMHGPPGNGKTSIIRALGWALREIPMVVLRPANSFDDADLQTVFRRWTEHAPAVLVIEDLDHILKIANPSQFLNLIDGIEGALTGGLLLLATTNHPELLDPALNNRPGRFDVVIEIASPDLSLRRSFFASHLPETEQEVREKLAEESSGLSFAHLHEILRLSGLLALHEERTSRSAQDLQRAAEMVRDTHHSAMNGFPTTPQQPFGLAQFRRKGYAAPHV